MYIGSGDNKIHVRKKSKYNQNKSLKYIKLIKKTFTITKNKKNYKTSRSRKKSRIIYIKKPYQILNKHRINKINLDH